MNANSNQLTNSGAKDLYSHLDHTQNLFIDNENLTPIHSIIINVTLSSPLPHVVSTIQYDCA